MGQSGGLLARQSRVSRMVYGGLADLFDSMPSQAMFELEHILRGHLRFAGLIEYIESCLTNPLKNSDLARKCHMSEAHFVRSFINAFGQAPAKYVRERRIVRASELLVATDMSIEDVSEKCGFSNRFHFSRIFKQIIGLPPATYRR